MAVLSTVSITLEGDNAISSRLTTLHIFHEILLDRASFKAHEWGKLLLSCQGSANYAGILQTQQPEECPLT